MTNEQLIALHYAHPVSILTLSGLQQQLTTLDEIITISSSILANLLKVSVKTAQTIQQVYERMRQVDLAEYYSTRDIQVIVYTDEAYPERLRTIFDAPTVLYAKGDITLLKAPRAMACIGSRQATNYSVDVVKCLLPPLIAQNYVIVSGLAKGADTLAHRAAVHYGGKTIAVLGHGFDTIYPASNKKLAQFLMKEHLIITEYAPHFAPKKEHFPQRNRLICGLAQALIVTEAAERSGTMITADLALEQGKDIFVAPGSITSIQSAGTNKLIKEGAIPVWNGHQIIEELQMFQIES